MRSAKHDTSRETCLPRLLFRLPWCCCCCCCCMSSKRYASVKACSTCYRGSCPKARRCLPFVRKCSMFLRIFSNVSAHLAPPRLMLSESRSGTLRLRTASPGLCVTYVSDPPGRRKIMNFGVRAHAEDWWLQLWSTVAVVIDGCSCDWRLRL